MSKEWSTLPVLTLVLHTENRCWITGRCYRRLLDSGRSVASIVHALSLDNR